MSEISCEICMDLMPLVRDGLASEDSRNAVLSHVGHCESCRSLFEELPIQPSVPNKAIDRIGNKIRFYLLVLLMFGIFFGLSLTGGSDLFYNSLVMPIIGVLGYYIFRWKAAAIVPVLLFGTHVTANFLHIFRDTEYMDISALILLTALYSFFALLGVLIAGLIHFAFRKE